MDPTPASAMRRTTLTAAILAAACTDAAAPAAGPPADVLDLAGLQARIAEHGDRPLLLNFWATWCAPCIAELPDLAAVSKEFTAKGGAVLAVSLDLSVPGTDPATLRRAIPAFLARRGLQVPAALYGGDAQALRTTLRLPAAIPVTLALAPGGKEVARHEGRATRADLERLARTARAR